MPIRRAAATPSQEKTPSTAAEKEPEASPEESPAADEEAAASSAAASEPEEADAPGKPEAAENGEKTDGAAGEEKGEAAEKKELKDGYKYEKTKVKKVKRTIPAWASISGSKKVPVTNFSGTQHKVDDILIEAIMSCDDRGGVSYQSLLKYIGKKYPGMEIEKKKFLIKKAMKKHLEKGTIKQLKGKGLSGTFAIRNKPVLSKKAAQKMVSLGDALPLIITRLCEPKEASYNLIKKYLEQHFPNLNIENRPDVLRTALVKAVERRQLERITGKGASGTFQLKRTGNKVLLKGGVLEDAITAAITAMNEPKTCSTTTLRRYLIDANKDKKEYQLVAHLRRTLTKCKVLGWMEQITGHGFNGTYQLSFPFYPSPTVLYPDMFKQPPPKRKQPAASSSSEEEEDEEEEDDDDDDEETEDEAPSRKRRPVKRPPPKVRHPPPTKKARSAAQSRAAGRRRTLVKKSPAKKATPPAVLTGRKAKVVKEPSPPPPPPPKKATPVKKSAPPRKTKTPAVKKLSKRGSKQPKGGESSAKEDAGAPEKRRGASRRSKPDDSPAEEPAAKKAATKAGSRQPDEPANKKVAKSSKQTTRKSKRGKH
ncbi:heterochromatin protein 1-binding protein 3 isoform X2 [Takifugu flavidus]|uniref:heterochromatin protein 1-binding protein 3 isoform X2 n=1 Tax=Takifugu flavidus TaxID=433684 RepID=UPI002544326E|nr:heterochromatin protein 1-binding protein 3 isoform X2 [Takifugu flavidus]